MDFLSKKKSKKKLPYDKLKMTTYVARMVDESRQITTFGSVDNAIQINAEQVGRSYAHSFVLCFA